MVIGDEVRVPEVEIIVARLDFIDTDFPGDVTKWLTFGPVYNMIAMVEFNFAPEATYE